MIVETIVRLVLIVKQFKDNLLTVLTIRVNLNHPQLNFSKDIKVDCLEAKIPKDKDVKCWLKKNETKNG